MQRRGMIRTRPSLAIALSLALLPFRTPTASAAEGDRVRLKLDATEADQVLSILDLRAAGRPVDRARWEALFATEPYRRLKAREAAIAERFHAPEIVLKDEAFEKFVLTDDLLARAPRLRAALERWKKADLEQAAQRALRYLPVSATIRATVYPVIKPNTNSFVWETSTDPAIFLYLDPDVGAPKLENTVAHELHHIGLASALAKYEQGVRALPERPRAVAETMEAFGEGLAMLAAAGGPDVDPHEASPPADRERWRRDMASFDRDLAAIDTFFVDVLDGKFADRKAIDEKASAFYGAQGPWYTVGYRMAVVVEKRFGRPALIETMLDPRRLLVLYNRAAAEENARGGKPAPLWSARVLDEVRAGAD